MTLKATEAPISVSGFALHSTRQSLARLLARYELFKLQMEVKGSIVECGVYEGEGVLSWAKLSAALEPYAIHRKIIGFDTFSGFPSIDDKDENGLPNAERRPGGFGVVQDVYERLQGLIRDYDANRFLNQFEKVTLVRGDAVETIPAFIKAHPYLLVSLLFLDFDLYTPTKAALESFLPRMSRGAVVAFDEINSARWPGETQALLETIDLKRHSIRRFTMDPNIAYIVL